MDDMIIKLVKLAKKRHGGNKVQIFPSVHNNWHDSYAFRDRIWHVLEYKLNVNEKTSHCIAIDVDNNLLEDN